MKKFILFAATLFATGAMMAQTFVSTEPSNRNAILEEYTGINCGYCPDGHARANAACEAHPGHAWAINIHQGGYAANTYTTQWGDALAAQTGLNGYPAGTVNRHVFSGTKTTLDRGQFARRIDEICAMPSPVNVAARATIDPATRVMNIEVEAYYTANSNVSTNYLNIAILQNNIIGHQSNYGNFNPEYIIGSQYRHMHMLRDLVTGQWGVSIDNTTENSYYHNTFTYEIPQTISNVNMVLEDLEVIVFIAEGHQEILSGCKASILMMTGAPQITAMNIEQSNNCDIEFNGTITFANSSYDTITSAEITYVIDGNTDVLEWADTLAPGKYTRINLPTLNNDFTANTDIEVTANFSNVNGEVVEGETFTTIARKNFYSVAGPLHFVLGTDKDASQNSFKFMKIDGTVIAQGGPWNDLTVNRVYEHRYTISPAEPGCYVLEVYDAGENGINNGHGAGFFTLDNAAGEICRNDGQFGAKAAYYFNITNAGDGSFVGIDDAKASVIGIYPNPTTNILNIEGDQTINQVIVYDMAGRQVMNINGNVNKIATETLSNGIYTIRIITGSGISTEKFVKE